jgi:hypothetical protein
MSSLHLFHLLTMLHHVTSPLELKLKHCIHITGAGRPLSGLSNSHPHCYKKLSQT